MNRHIKSLHTRKKELTCKVEGCDYICGRSDHLKSHVRNRHKEVYFQYYPESTNNQKKKQQKQTNFEQADVIEQNNILLKQLVKTEIINSNPDLVNSLLKLLP